MKKIAVSSFKGGTAKTSFSLNVGSALAMHHEQRVLLIDFDAQANLTAGLGFDPDGHDSLASVLQDAKDIKEVILQTEVPNLDLIPADTWLERVEVTGNLAKDRYSHEKLKHLVDTLDYDYVIIDTPPSLCWLTESAMIAANYGLVCATPEFYSIKGLQRLSYFMENIAERHPLEVLGVALSFWNKRGKNNEAFLEVVETAFPDKVFETKIRRDIRVTEASIHGKPVFVTAPRARAAEDYWNITNEMLERIKHEVHVPA